VPSLELALLPELACNVGLWLPAIVLCVLSPKLAASLALSMLSKLP